MVDTSGSLSVRIRSARRRRGFSQEALARVLGVSKNTVARWEAGAQPRGKTVAKIAAALGVSNDWLLAGDRAA